MIGVVEEARKEAGLCEALSNCESSISPILPKERAPLCSSLLSLESGSAAGFCTTLAPSNGGLVCANPPPEPNTDPDDGLPTDPKALPLLAMSLKAELKGAGADAEEDTGVFPKADGWPNADCPNADEPPKAEVCPNAGVDVLPNADGLPKAGTVLCALSEMGVS